MQRATVLNHGDTLGAMLVKSYPADLLAIFQQGPSKGICEMMAKSQCQNDKSEHPMMSWAFQVE